MAKLSRIIFMVSSILFVCAFFSFCVSLMYAPRSEHVTEASKDVATRASFDPNTNVTVLTPEN